VIGAQNWIFTILDDPVDGALVSAFAIRYPDLERMLPDRSVQVNHTTLFRWFQAYAFELDRRIRPHLRTIKPLMESR
jgi:transposase-like protein